jgi:hypothetical protein
VKQINSILNQSVQICGSYNKKKFGNETLRIIGKLLTTPLEALKMTILDLTAYPKLMNYLSAEDKKNVANEICETVVKYQFKLTEVE